MSSESTKKVALLTCCTLCQQKYSRTQTLRAHYLKAHEVLIKNLDFPPGLNTIVPKNSIAIDITSSSHDSQTCSDVYCCPGCLLSFHTLKLLDDHIQENHIKDPPELDASQGVGGLLGNQESLSTLSEKATAHEVAVKRSVGNMNDLYMDSKINDQSRKIIECLNLKPVILEDDSMDDDRTICFVSDAKHSSLIKKNNKRMKLNIPEVSHEFYMENCIHVPRKPSVIDSIIRNSPYCELLSFRSYTEIEKNQLMLLNTSWRTKPYLSFALSHLLCGAILVNENEALLINGIESYSRLPAIDAHCEQFVGVSHQSSAPNLTSSYPNELRFTTLREDNSKKLLISSRAANFLVISSIRIDLSLKPEIGPTTSNFTPSKNTSIYLDQNSIMKANAINDEGDQYKLPIDIDPVNHIRQLRSKFGYFSTYCLARSFSDFTSCCNLQPYSIYTFVNSNAKETNDAVLGSRIMVIVADAVHKEPSNPHIKKEDFVKLIDKKKTTSIHKSLESILALFGDDLDSIHIIGNTQLSNILRNVADSTTYSLKTANEQIVKNIWNYFKTDYKD